MSRTFTQAYNDLVDWNAKYIGKKYEAVESSVMQPIFDVLPEGEDDVLPEGHWLEQYLDFCPMCGSFESQSTGNMAVYPEAYYVTSCASCGFRLGVVDNSPPQSWYNYKSNHFEAEL